MERKRPYQIKDQFSVKANLIAQSEKGCLQTSRSPVHGEKSREKKAIEIYTGFLLRLNKFAWWKLAFKLIFEVSKVQYDWVVERLWRY